MTRAKTQEEFENELSIIFPNIQVIGKYINTNTKIHCKCLIHDFEFDAYPVNMLHGHGCRKCGNEKHAKARVKTHDKFVEDVKNINPDIKILGEYINVNTAIKVECLIDGYTWNADPRKLLRGVKCAVCTNHKVMTGVNDVATTRPDLVKYFKNKDEATQYTSGSEKMIDTVCPECGYDESQIRIGNLSRFGFSCNGCYEKKFGRKRVPYGYWNEETIKQYLCENLRGYQLLEISLPSQNDVGSLKVHLKCPNEKHEAYWTYWKNIVTGYTCFQCHLEESMSKGERMAESFFEKHNMIYETQKRFEDCKDILALPFDFYLPDYNLIVEIMGEQHERPVEYFGGQTAFERCIKHDNIKREYLKKNDINILDIWYYELDNMEDLILNKIQEILSTIQN